MPPTPPGRLALWRPTVVWICVYAFAFSVFALWILLDVPRTELDVLLLRPRLGGHHLVRLLQAANAAWAIVLGPDLVATWRMRERGWSPLFGVLFAVTILVTVHLALAAMERAAETLA